MCVCVCVCVCLGGGGAGRGNGCGVRVSSVQCCFTSTETVGTFRDGELRTSTSIFTQLLSSGFELSAAEV